MEFLARCGDTLARAQGVYLFLAILGSVFFVFQLLTTLFGGGGEHDFDEGSFELQDHDGFDLHGLKLLSVKGIISFVTFFGWAGWFWGDRGWLGLALAFVCGSLMMFLTALSLWLLLKLQQSGTVSDRDCVGRSATVYIAIPAGRQPGGQITIALPGGTRQSRAVADAAIPRGEAVVVRESLGADLFLVSVPDQTTSNQERK